MMLGNQQAQQQQQQQPMLPLNFELPFLSLRRHCMEKCGQQVDCFETKNSMLKSGGSDPLDFIFVHKNDQDPELRHWHYVGFGLSDIYCNNLQCQFARAQGRQVAELYPLTPVTHPPELCGYGFELTFRLRCHTDDEWSQGPPEWPRHMMQSLAKYTFLSKNTFNVGDHVAWNRSLDEHDDSQVEHILMALDPCLQQVDTCMGLVRFIQIVGVFKEELQAARRLNAREVLDIMMQRPETGGPLLVTDMRRGQDIFQLDPDNRERVEEAILSIGSDMIQISTNHKYSSSRPKWFDEVESLQESLEHGEFKYKPTPTTPPPSYELANTRTPSRMSYESESALMVENAELVDTRYYQNVYLLMPYKSAKMLPIALNGRLRHRNPFTFQNFRGDLLTTLVPEGASVPSLVNHEQPLAKKGTWLQILITDQFRDEMLQLIGDDFADEPAAGPLRLPKNYSWPQFKLYLTVVEEL